jgi:hypothetical protein
MTRQKFVTSVEAPTIQEPPRGSGIWRTLLRVALTIRQPFTLNDVSVAVWKACPDTFGMKGYPYPDNHKVHYILYGSRGLIARGLIERVSEGLFQVEDSPELQKILKDRRLPEKG